MMSILQNEKYKGDAILQKSFTTDFLTKRMKKNEGEVPQYFVEGAHEAIISPEQFELVQEEIARRKELGRAYSDTAFHSKLICGDCGSFYGRKVWHSTDIYRSVIYQCNYKFKNEQRCTTPTLTEDTIKARFLEAYSQLMIDRSTVLADCEEIRKMLCDTADLDSQIQQQEDEMTIAAQLMQEHVRRNASVAQSQEKYEDETARIEKRYDEALQRHEALLAEKDKRKRRSRELKAYITALTKQPTILEDWDERLWITLLDTATVNADSSITFAFKGGRTIKV